MRTIVLTASVVVFGCLLLPSPSNAQSETCFMTTSDGRTVSLGSLCQGQDKTQPPSPNTPSTQKQHPFPSWLIGNDSKAHDRYKTGFKAVKATGIDYSIWSYQKRFLLAFRQWPYTLLPENKTEWKYLDCSTGWEYSKSLELVGRSSETAIEPGKFEKIAPGGLERNRKQCRDMGIQPKF